MPIAEESKLPKGREKGARKRDEEFIEATGGTPVQSPVNQPRVIEPQSFEVEDDEDFDEEEEEGFGADLEPDEMAALFDDVDPGIAQADLQQLSAWLPTIREIAARDGASQQMRSLADALVRFNEQDE